MKRNRKTGSGRFRHTVDVKAFDAGSANAYNEAADGSTTIFPGLSCEVSALRGRELEHARQVKASVTHRVRWRSLDTVKPDHWLVPSFDNTKQLHVDSVTHDERKHDYEALCTERVT